ncbi:MAG: phosphatase [Imperialibacter sp.]|uniref:phosphatase PAP2 family protein n=1 Tax=Imperialibacter sp. TaxID=2038411 RepID=UPI0032EBFBAF
MNHIYFWRTGSAVFLMLTISVATLVAQPLTGAGSELYKEKQPDPVRGHYKSISKFDAQPSEGGEEIDRLKYPLTDKDLQRAKSRKPYYLTENESFDIKAYPANSSEQTRKELDYLLALQEQRFKEDMDICLYMATVWFSHSYKPGDKEYPRMRRNLYFIGRSIGTWFNADSLPATTQLVSNVWADASFYIWKYKIEFARIRPYKLEPKLKNIEETNWPAYPSGHAANSYVNAYLFSELAPEFKDVFIKDALDMAHSRERIGVHYPSDSEASRLLARQLVNKLFESAEFREDFAKAKEEWTRVRARNF